ncbi:MAG: hypothetical protein U1C74_00875 [Phenylobacterium sp.]|nr:hypothetical protein [Phenylobacterium sp.]
MRRHLIIAAVVAIAVLAAVMFLMPRQAATPTLPVEVAPPVPAPAPSASRPEAPEAFRGVWAARADDCGPGRETRLVIAANQLMFHESAGPIRSVTQQTVRDVTFAVSLTGEGETRTVRHRFLLNNDGDRLTALDAAGAEMMVRRRCPETPDNAA